MIFIKRILFESGVFSYSDIFEHENETIKRYRIRKDGSIHWQTFGIWSDEELDVIYDEYLRQVKNELRKNKLKSLNN